MGERKVTGCNRAVMLCIVRTKYMRHTVVSRTNGRQYIQTENERVNCVSTNTVRGRVLLNFSVLFVTFNVLSGFDRNVDDPKLIPPLLLPFSSR